MSDKTNGDGFEDILADDEPGQQVIVLPKMDIRRATITLVGDTPLVVNRKPPGLDKELEKAAGGQPAGAKKKYVPLQEYGKAFHWVSKEPAKYTDKNIAAGKFGFPCSGLKACAISAASFEHGITKVATRGAFHVMGELAEINGKPKMRTDVMPLPQNRGMRMAYRPEFWPWSITFTIRYDDGALSLEQIIQLYNRGGFSVGLGENRPGKSGNAWGLFHVSESETL